MKLSFLFGVILLLFSLQAISSGTYLPPPQVPPEGVDCEEGEDCEDRVLIRSIKEVRS